MTFTMKATEKFPPHLIYVATLPWEVKKFNFVKRYKRYNLKIIPCVTKMKRYMSYG